MPAATPPLAHPHLPPGRPHRCRRYGTAERNHRRCRRALRAAGSRNGCGGLHRSSLHAVVVNPSAPAEHTMKMTPPPKHSPKNNSRTQNEMGIGCLQLVSETTLFCNSHNSIQLLCLSPQPLLFVTIRGTQSRGRSRCMQETGRQSLHLGHRRRAECVSPCARASPGRRSASPLAPSRHGVPPDRHQSAWSSLTLPPVLPSSSVSASTHAPRQRRYLCGREWGIGTRAHRDRSVHPAPHPTVCRDTHRCAVPVSFVLIAFRCIVCLAHPGLS